MCTFINVYFLVYRYIYTHTYIYIYIYTHTHTHTHTYVCVWCGRSFSEYMHLMNLVKYLVSVFSILCT